MAYLDDQNQLQQTQGSQGSQTNAPAPAPAAQNVSGSGGADVGGISTAGVGNGGTGGWTNIQAYINANKDSNSGASALNNTVGKQFDQEKSDMTNSAANTKGQADSQVSGQLGQDQASQLIGQYQSSPNQADIKTQFGNTLNNQYAGPNNWTYAQSAPTTNYGTALGSDQGFQGMMNGLYNNAAGGQINSGELALQQQLDVNSPQLNQARSDLGSKYKALQDLSGQTMNDTNQAIQNDVSQYGQNQTDLKNYMTGQSSALKGNLDAFYDGTFGGRVGPQFNPSNAIGQYNSINDLLGNGASYSQPSGPGAFAKNVTGSALGPKAPVAAPQAAPQTGQVYNPNTGTYEYRGS